MTGSGQRGELRQEIMTAIVINFYGGRKKRDGEVTQGTIAGDTAYSHQ